MVLDERVGGPRKAASMMCDECGLGHAHGLAARLMVLGESIRPTAFMMRDEGVRRHGWRTSDQGVLAHGWQQEAKGR